MNKVDMLTQNDEATIGNHHKLQEDHTYKWHIVWSKVISLLIIHIKGIYGIYLALFVVNWLTFFFVIFSVPLRGMGVTAGSHRLYSHKSYKAKLPLRYLLVILQASTMQSNIIVWVRDHRVHHKYTDTDADPHNSKRGFFFSHMGWLLIKKHPDVITKGKTIDITDVSEDPAVKFQIKYFALISISAGLVFPIFFNWYFFSTSLWNSYFCMFAVYIFLLHIAFSVNSFAHFYGSKPYDKNIRPAQNAVVSFFALGEGWHNYHHVFPWDYRTNEWGSYLFNTTNIFIHFMARIGWAYDLKMASKEMIENRKKRTGSENTKADDKIIWGWGDSDMTKDDFQKVKILNKIPVN